MLISLTGSMALQALPWSDSPNGADRAWADRSVGFDGEWARSVPVIEAIQTWQAELVERPRDLEIHAKLLRALNFRGSFTNLSERQRAAVYQRGVDVAEAAMRILYGTDVLNQKPEKLAAQSAAVPEAASLHFWAALHWGQWGRFQGNMAALRQGVAKRIRLHARVAIELDGGYENGGPYRVLGRLHAVAPRVPLVTGWVRRSTARELLDKAFKTAPQDILNRLYLIELQLKDRGDASARARESLEALVAEQPSDEYLVEDSFALREAREFYDSLR